MAGKKKIVTKKTVKKDFRMSASSAGQWMNCTESLNGKQNPFRKIEDSEFIGNTTHRVIELILSQSKEAISLVILLKIIEEEPEQTFKNLTCHFESATLLRVNNEIITSIMKDVQFYFNFGGVVDNVDNGLKTFTNCKEKDFHLALLNAIKSTKKENTLLFSELPLEVLFSGGKVSGTIDNLLVEIEKVKNRVSINFTIIDLKTGWVPVFAQESEQLKVYGTLVLESFHRFVGGVLHTAKFPGRDKLIIKLESLNTRIVQPPLLSVSDNPLDVDYLIKNHQNIIKSYEKIYNSYKKKSTATTGSHCLYCVKKDLCKPLKKKVKEFLNPEFQDQTYDRVEIWSELLEYVPTIKKLAEDLNKNARIFLESKMEVPGYQLVSRNGKRVFKGEASMIEHIKTQKGLLLKDFFTQQLKSPTEIEKILKKKGKRFNDVLNGMYYQPITRQVKKIK